ncbi:hypothetical protein L9F63_001704, partial [Diploptera punctata]
MKMKMIIWKNLLNRAEVNQMEKDVNVTPESKNSSSDEIDDDIDDITAQADEEISVKSEANKESSIKEIPEIGTAMDTTENEISTIDVESDSGSDSGHEEDNVDVKVKEEEKKESRVSRFLNTFRRKKPTSVQSAGLEGCGERLAVRETRQ